jgi:hypothetical protein
MPGFFILLFDQFEIFAFSPPLERPVHIPEVFAGHRGYRQADSSVSLHGGTWFFLQGGISKKILLPSAVAKHLGFFSEPYAISLVYGQTPNV